MSAACGSDSGSDRDPKPGEDTNVSESEFELYTYWTSDEVANDFAETVKVVVEEFTAQNPDVLVRNGSVSWQASGDYGGTVLARIDGDMAPDIWQVNGRQHIQWTAGQGYSAPLEGLFEKSNYVFAIEDLGVDGDQYAVPMNVIRDNVIYVNLNVFRKAGVTTEEIAKLKSDSATLADLFAVADKIGAYYAELGEGSGTPFGIYHSVTDVTSTVAASKYPWAFKDAFVDCLLPGTLGVEGWKSLIDEQSAEKWKGPKVAEALMNLKHFIDRSNSDFLDGAPEAAPWNTLLDERSAMVILGDWYVSTLRRSPLEFGKDWDSFACPGTGGAFIGHSDVWVMPPNAPHPQNAKKFLEVASSPQVQLAFNAKFGALPAVQVDESELSEENGFGEYSRAAFRDLQKAGFSWRTEARMVDAFNILSVLGPYAEAVKGVNMTVEGELPVSDAISAAMDGFVARCTEVTLCK
jgi:glucose/mannose transport system substrate-binding protein